MEKTRNLRYSKIHSAQSQGNFLPKSLKIYKPMCLLNALHSIIPFHIKFNHRSLFPSFPRIYMQAVKHVNAGDTGRRRRCAHSRPEFVRPRLVLGVQVQKCPRFTTSSRVNSERLRIILLPLCRNELGINSTLLKTKFKLKFRNSKERNILYLIPDKFLV